MTKTRQGNRVVVQLYLVIVAVTGVMGYLLAGATNTPLEPVLFGFVALPPTPVGVAVFGMVTIGLLLGALLGLVVVVSRIADESET